MSTKPAIGLAISAVYGPYLVMASYTVGWIACSHCKQTACLLLPVGPGLIAADLGRHLFDLPRLPDLAWFTTGSAISVIVVGLLVFVLRAGKSIISIPLTASILAASSYAAIGTLALIRM